MEQEEGAFNQLYKSQLPTSITEPEPVGQVSMQSSAEPKLSGQLDQNVAVSSVPALQPKMQLVQV